MGLPGRRYPREVRDERRLLRVAGVRRGAHLLEEPLKTAAEHAEYAGRLFHPVGVGQAGGHEAKVARAERTRGLLARPVLDENAYLPVEDVERLVRARVGVGRDDVAGGGLAGDDAELAIGLVAAEQHREQVAEELRVLALAAAEEESIRAAREQAFPLRTLRGVDQVLERHRARLHIPVKHAYGGHVTISSGVHRRPGAASRSGL